MRMSDSEELKELVSRIKFVHVLGAGMNSEKPANTAISDLIREGVESGSRTSQGCGCQHCWIPGKTENRRRCSPGGCRSIPSTGESA